MPMRWASAAAAKVLLLLPLLLSACWTAQAAQAGCYAYEGVERGVFIGEGCVCDVGFYGTMCDQPSFCSADPLEPTSFDGQAGYALVSSFVNDIFTVGLTIPFAERRRLTKFALSSPACGYPLGDPASYSRMEAGCSDFVQLSLPVTNLLYQGDCQQTLDNGFVQGEIIIEVEEYTGVSLRGFEAPWRVFESRIPFSIKVSQTVTTSGMATVFSPAIVTKVLSRLDAYDGNTVIFELETFVQRPYELDVVQAHVAPLSYDTLHLGIEPCTYVSPDVCRQVTRLTFNGVEDVDGPYSVEYTVTCLESGSLLCQQEGSAIEVDFTVITGGVFRRYSPTPAPIAISLTTDHSQYLPTASAVELSISVNSAIGLTQVQVETLVATGPLGTIALVTEGVPDSETIILTDISNDELQVLIPTAFLPPTEDELVEYSLEATIRVFYGDLSRRRSTDGASKTVKASTTFSMRR